MPLYTFLNPETQEYRDVFFGMNDVKNYSGENNDEKWVRVYCSPNMSMDTKINPFSQKDMLRKTENVSNYGQLWDFSKEMSQQRESKIGAPDPLLDKAKKNFYKPEKKQ